MSKKLKIVLAVVAVIVLIVGGFAAYTWSALHLSYASGDRSGYVQKLSKKGWVCKTWEGEMAMVSLPGTAPEIFHFSVRDEAVAAKLNQTLGKRVAIHYEQHKGVPTQCFGETDYFITDVRVAE